MPDLGKIGMEHIVPHPNKIVTGYIDLMMFWWLFFYYTPSFITNMNTNNKSNICKPN